MPILQNSTLRHREVEGYDQGHTANSWWSQDLNSGSLSALPPGCVKLTFCTSFPHLQARIPSLFECHSFREEERDPRDGSHVFKNATCSSRVPPRLPLHSGPSSAPIAHEAAHDPLPYHAWLSACGASVVALWRLPWAAPEAATLGTTLEDSNAPEPRWAKPRVCFLPVSCFASKSPKPASRRLWTKGLFGFLPEAPFFGFRKISRG